MNAQEQKEILNEYARLFLKPTLKVMSSNCGIQQTRFFRIMNGSMMRLDEYQKVLNAIRAEKNSEQLVSLISECEKKLSRDALKEIEVLVEKKLNLWNLKQKPQTYSNAMSAC